MLAGTLGSDKISRRQDEGDQISFTAGGTKYTGRVAGATMEGRRPGRALAPGKPRAQAAEQALSGSSVRPAPAPARARVCHHRGVDARARHRRQHRGFQHPQRLPTPASGPRRGSHRRARVGAAWRRNGLRYRFSYPALQDYRKATSVFSDVFAFSVLIGGLGADGKTTQFVYHGVSGNLFSALGITPAAGRLFVPGEGEQPNAERVVVLGHSYLAAAVRRGSRRRRPHGENRRRCRRGSSASRLRDSAACSKAPTWTATCRWAPCTAYPVRTVLQRPGHHATHAARAAAAWREPRARAGGGHRRRGSARHTVPGDRKGPDRARHSRAPGAAGAAAVHRAPDAAGAIAAPRARVARPAHRLHERREPAARASDGTRARDGRASRRSARAGVGSSACCSSKA